MNYLTSCFNNCISVAGHRRAKVILIFACLAIFVMVGSEVRGQDALPMEPISGVVESQSLPEPSVRHFQWIHLVQLSIVAGLIFWGYSLVMSGRRGLGWKILLAMGMLLVSLGGIAASLFNEVTADNEVGDWDDDSEVTI